MLVFVAEVQPSISAFRVDLKIIFLTKRKKYKEYIGSRYMYIYL